MARRWIQSVSIEVDEDTGAVLVDLGDALNGVLDAVTELGGGINDLVAMLKLEPVAGSGQLLTGAGMSTDGTVTVVAGASYTVTANDGTFHVGVATLDGNDDYLASVPAGVTRIVTVPAGITTLYYRALSGATARLARIVNT
ncbi:MAG: hypothetical protein GXY74_15535 [Phycisphaerae bacterium]|nr:hypothetical protein [Phycisphaerae bacterium]